MQRAAGIEGMPARGAFICRACVIAGVLGIRHLLPARPAHHAQLLLRHRAKLVIGELLVTQRAGEPTAAGAALVRDNVDKRMPVTAAPLRVDGALNLSHVLLPRETPEDVVLNVGGALRLTQAFGQSGEEDIDESVEGSGEEVLARRARRLLAVEGSEESQDRRGSL